MNEKIQIKEISSGGTFDNPKFIINLDQSGSEEHQKSINLDVLSKLAGNSDVVISLDSSLLNLPTSKREPYALKFLESVRESGLEYRCSKITPNSSPSFISTLFGAKNAQAQEIVVYVPNETWKTEALQNILPLFGVRYFVVKENTEGIKVLDDLQKLLDDEKLDYFKLVIYDVISYNCISLFSKDLTISEIKAMLGIK